jgi:probable HAF family extracellular repeat protein
MPKSISHFPALRTGSKLLALTLTLVLLDQAAQAKSHYTVSDRGTIGYSSSGGYVATADINNRGEVVGYYRPGNGFDQGFISTGGQVQQLGNFSVAVARGINDLGQAVGLYSHQDLFNSSTAYLFLSSNGQTPQIMPGSNGFANAVNDRGEVTGGFYKGGKGPEHAFVYTVNTTNVHDLGTLNGDVGSEGVSINIRGQVVGVSYNSSNVERGFLYSNGQMYDLGPTFEPASINDLGVVVGNVALPGNVTHAAFYWRGRIFDLGVLPGTTSSLATGINDLGQIVGSSDNRPFLYECGRMYDLSALVLPNSGWVLENPSTGIFGAITINAFGQIAVTGNNGVVNQRGFLETHVLVLTPVGREFFRP